MDIETFRDYCIHKKGVTEHFPFDETTLVFKVADKMFALTGLGTENFKVNLKCDPEKAEMLRETHEEIIPGYHMSKKHWNTVDFQGSLSNQLLQSLIDDSYQLVVDKLPKKTRELLGV